MHALSLSQFNYMRRQKKEYTRIRQFYAWTGFIGMALTVPAIIFLLTLLFFNHI